MLAQQLQMQRRAVSLVLVERVLRIQRVQAHQVGIARGLGQNGRSGDRGLQGVALDDGLHRAGQLGRLVAGHQRQLRRHGQALDGPLHRQHGGAQDIQGIDLANAGAGDTPGQRALLDLQCQRLAPGGFQHF
ncbi:hypothetical protein G6F24_016461 [Rhizopus arrhizus]|nr:hypothetical protein G6F24_016461 [Rhizopus arrhizus]